MPGLPLGDARRPFVSPAGEAPSVSIAGSAEEDCPLFMTRMPAQQNAGLDAIAAMIDDDDEAVNEAAPSAELHAPERPSRWGHVPPPLAGVPHKCGL